ncbi:MAG: response regulator, partial [Verrucomicrobiota bacterium]
GADYVTKPFSRPELIARVEVQLRLRRETAAQKRLTEELRQASIEAQAAVEAKGRFLAMMSHEIRSPMNGITGMAQMLLRTPLSPDQKHFAESIQQGSHALLGIINDILDFSKIQAGKLTFEDICFDLVWALEAPVSLLSAPARDKGLDLYCAVDPALNRWMRGDPTRFRQVVFNLLSNAIKFTEQGEVLVEARAVPGDPEAVEVRVSDTGVGIDPELASQLFEPFSQQDASTTRRFGGTGLGLAICKALTDGMHGTISFAPRQPQGTVFSMTARIAEPEAAMAAPGSDLAGLRLLYVDAELRHRIFMRCKVERLGGELVECASAEKAIDHLSLSRDEGGCDCVLLGDELDGQSGVEMAASLAMLAPEDRLPVLLISRSSNSEEIENLEELGITRRLFWPLSSQLLAENAAEALGQRREVSDSVRRRHCACQLRVLVAEDGLTNQETIRYFLRELGHECTLVNNGAEAVEMVEHEAFDVILMDIHMPVMDGVQASQAIRAKSGKSLDHSIYIIALTASVMHEEREEFMGAGMNDFVAKPVDLHKLEEALGRAIEHQLKRGHELGARTTLAEKEAAAFMIDADDGELDAIPPHVLEIYYKEIPKQLDQLEIALREEDAITARRIAHLIAGSAAQVRRSSLMAVCKQMEAHAKTGELAEAATLFPSARAEFEADRTDDGTREVPTSTRLSELS